MNAPDGQKELEALEIEQAAREGARGEEGERGTATWRWKVHVELNDLFMEKPEVYL